MCQRNKFSFDLGNFVISLLSYIVENGRLDFYAMKISDIKLFTDKYFDNQSLLSNDDINTILNRLEGVNPDGTPILYQYGDTSEKVAYITFDIENNGYRITDMGLQFLISSREVPQDSKVTISLYLFKLQIEKHRYQSALDTIKNINLETKRQLSLKDKVLNIARYDATLGNKMYNEYWKDFVSLRNEEREHYQQAKDFLKQYQDVSQNDNITPNDRKLLNKIDVELNISTTLQNQYILEISSMGKQLAEMSLNSMNNIFENRFNFKEHLENVYHSNDISVLTSMLTPLLLPKKVKFFDLSVPFAQQVVKSEIDAIDEPITVTKPFVDYSKMYENRQFNNYCVFFEILIGMLETSPIEDIREYINRVSNAKGIEAINSIDFLSFLTDLSSFSEVNSSTDTNVQTIHLLKPSSNIVCDTFESMLSKCWFDRLSKNYQAEMLISTDVDDIVYLDSFNKRSIGNLKINLVKGELI